MREALFGSPASIIISLVLLKSPSAYSIALNNTIGTRKGENEELN